MNKSIYHIIGLMSGTSLDGLDLAYCCFEYKNDQWNFEIPYSTTIEYDSDLKKSLADAPLLNGMDLIKLDRDYGTFLGQKVLEFIQVNNIQNVDFISSHGHTVFHQPNRGFTLQIGSGSAIAAATKCTVVSDFRSLDVANGGQGAPLVPIGDILLFSDYRFCLNLGGFSNVSFYKTEKRIAFDICPVNIVLNDLSMRLGKDYDDGGKIARSGMIIRDMLGDLNGIDYYFIDPPKSLGKEWVEEKIQPLLKKYENHSIQDLIATFTEHVAIQISRVLEAESNSEDSVLVTGGGAFNTYLIEMIKKNTRVKVIVPTPEIINYKEALIFAFLGLLRFENKVNCLASVTGAKSDSCGGAIYNPQNY